LVEIYINIYILFLNDNTTLVLVTLCIYLIYNNTKLCRITTNYKPKHILNSPLINITQYLILKLINITIVLLYNYTVTRTTNKITKTN